jgi:hypothetical protein
VNRPSGTVTFLFTDIEGSTRLWESAPDAMRTSLARHEVIVRGAIEAHGGYVFATGGDGFAAAFARPHDAYAAAETAQAGLGTEVWPEGRCCGCGWLCTRAWSRSATGTISVRRRSDQPTQNPAKERRGDRDVRGGRPTKKRLPPPHLRFRLPTSLTISAIQSLNSTS